MSTDNFNVQVKVTPKAQEFQQDLQKIADKIVVNVNVKMSGQQGVKDLNKDFKDLDKNSKSLGQSFGDIVTKVGKFYLATKPIQMMQQAFDEAIETVKEFDDTLVEFRKVSDLSGDSLTAYTQKLAEMGEVTGSTMTAMVSAATEFKKSGYSDEDAATLASVAEKYRNISDEQLSAGESANFIIAQLKAFNMTASESEHIIDAVYLIIGGI